MRGMLVSIIIICLLLQYWIAVFTMFRTAVRISLKQWHIQTVNISNINLDVLVMSEIFHLYVSILGNYQYIVVPGKYHQRFLYHAIYLSLSASPFSLFISFPAPEGKLQVRNCPCERFYCDILDHSEP